MVYDLQIDLKIPINEKIIFIKTLDLNKEWKDIKKCLDNIAIDFIENRL